VAESQSGPAAAFAGPARAISISSVSNRHYVGFACVVATAIGWGLNWPATKFVLAICPPLSARGFSGLAACIMLLTIATMRGETTAIPRQLWGRLITLSILNVSVWMGFTTASMLWLPAGQAATLAYTMPIWTTMLAWPQLGEPPSPRQIIASLLGAGAVAILVGGTGIAFDTARLPGSALALSAAGLFAFGTVLSKKQPIPLPPVTLTGWQVGIGSLPLLVGGLTLENAHWLAMPVVGWAALAYTAFVSMGACYLLWFAAVRHLSASMAAVGTLLTPVVGVCASTLALGDPLTTVQVTALVFVAVGILLAATTRTGSADRQVYRREGRSSRASR
jgi:drug/metabolite transporter (DMT)-like permease